MEVSLPASMSGNYMSPRTYTYLNNMYNVNGVLLPRGSFLRNSSSEATELDLTLDEPRLSGNPGYYPRGLATSADETKLYSIFGEQVFVGVGVNATEIGQIDFEYDDTINQDTSVSLAVGYTGVAIATGTKQYFIDYATDSLTELTDTDLPASSSVVYLDGRYVWAATDGETVHFSEVNDAGNVNALSFFDAESRPDPNRALAVIGNDLYVLGAQSIERFRNIGDSTAPFVRITNSIISVGYIGGLLDKLDSITFIGKGRGGAVAIYELTGSTFNIISNDTIGSILNDQKYALVSDVDSKKAKSLSFSEYGRNITVFNIPNKISFYCLSSAGVYQWGVITDNMQELVDHQEWGVRPFTDNFGSPDDDFSRTFNFNYSTAFNNETYVGWGAGSGSSNLDKAGIYSKVEIGYDRGDTLEQYPITKGFRTFFRNTDDKPLELSRVSLSISRSYNQSNMFTNSGLVNLRVSRNGIDWSDEITRSFSGINADDLLIFDLAGGLTCQDGWVGLIIESSTIYPFAIEKVIIND